jgi:hypothetical protein
MILRSRGRGVLVHELSLAWGARSEPRNPPHHRVRANHTLCQGRWLLRLRPAASWSNPTIASHEPGTAPSQSTNQQAASNLLFHDCPLDILPEGCAINSLRRNSRARSRFAPTIVNHQEPVLILGSALSLCSKQSFASLLVQEAAPCLGSAWHGFASPPCTRQIDSPPLASQGLASLALPTSHCLTLPSMEQEAIRASSAACFCK